MEVYQVTIVKRSTKKEYQFKYTGTQKEIENILLMDFSKKEVSEAIFTPLSEKESKELVEQNIEW